MPNYLIISKKRSEAQPLSKTIILTKLEFLVTRVITSTCSRNFFFEEKEKYLLSIIIFIGVQIQVLVFTRSSTQISKRNPFSLLCNHTTEEKSLGMLKCEHSGGCKTH